MTNPRHYNLLDRFIVNLQNGLHIMAGQPPHQRETPTASSIESSSLSDTERRHSAGLMRINHAGEVCAQALYKGQALTARCQETRKQLEQSAAEENDHLAWCQKRLEELNSHTSYLNPFWFIGSFLIGAFAGLWGDRWSLGFIVATEQQVVAHLEKHLGKLPVTDQQSRAILLQMQEDEAHHATVAQTIGASELPSLVKWLMQQSSKVMTHSAYWI